MPIEPQTPPDRLDLAIAESHRLMDETKRLIDLPLAAPSGGGASVTEAEGSQESGVASSIE